MEITIRKENQADYKAVFELIEKAFEKSALGDHREQYLVQRLRKSNAFIPELSMVAEDGLKGVSGIVEYPGEFNG